MSMAAILGNLLASYSGVMFSFFRHLGPSPIEKLVELPNDMLIDYMHQVLLGVVKSTVHNIIQSSKLSPEARTRVSDMLVTCKLPSQDYKRQLRALDTLKSWKATELKLFLLYGFMCFLNTLSVEMFAHFSLLSSSMRMLMNPKSDEEICLSDELVMVFRELAPFFYGETSQTFNKHTLVHLADQVKSAGPLSSLSTMAFESAHYQLKRAVGPNTTANLATSLAVKRHQRRFFRKQSKKREQTVTIGSLKLRHPTNCFVEIGGVGEVFSTCQSFQYNSQSFYCHNNSKCQWLSNGSCTHIVQFSDDNQLRIGQLCAIFADVPSRCASVEVKIFEKTISLEEKLIEKLAHKQTVNAEVAQMHPILSDTLERMVDKSAHFFVEEISDETTVVDLRNLVAPCIFRKVDDFYVVSVISTIFERD